MSRVKCKKPRLAFFDVMDVFFEKERKRYAMIDRINERLKKQYGFSKRVL